MTGAGSYFILSHKLFPNPAPLDTTNTLFKTKTDVIRWKNRNVVITLTWSHSELSAEKIHFCGTLPHKTNFELRPAYLVPPLLPIVII